MATVSISAISKRSSIAWWKAAATRPKTCCFEGVRLLEEQEKRRASLDEALARGMADVEAGRIRPIKDVFLELKERYRQIAEERGQ